MSKHLFQELFPFSVCKESVFTLNLWSLGIRKGFNQLTRIQNIVKGRGLEAVLVPWILTERSGLHPAEFLVALKIILPTSLDVNMIKYGSPEDC